MNTDHGRPEITHGATPDDIWSNSAVGNGTSSAFAEPEMIFDQAQAGQGLDDVEDAKPATQSRPNFAILGAAALIGIVVLGGGSYMGYKTFIGKRGAHPMASGPVGESVLVTPASTVPSQSTGGVFDATPALSGSAASGGVFGTGAATEVVADKAPSSVVITEPPESVSTQASAATNPASQVPAAASATSTTASAEKTPQSPQTQVASKGTSSVRPVATSEPKDVRKAPQKSKTTVATKAPKKTTPSGTVNRDREEVIADVRVVGVYPLTGKNAQAWLRSKQGATMVVREGDEINGIAILSVIPEKGLVKTSLGDLTSKGLIK